MNGAPKESDGSCVGTLASLSTGVQVSKLKALSLTGEAYLAAASRRVDLGGSKGRRTRLRDVVVFGTATGCLDAEVVRASATPPPDGQLLDDVPTTGAAHHQGDRQVEQVQHADHVGGDILQAVVVGGLVSCRPHADRA